MISVDDDDEGGFTVYYRIILGTERAVVVEVRTHILRLVQPTRHQLTAVVWFQMKLPQISTFAVNKLMLTLVFVKVKMQTKSTKFEEEFRGNYTSIGLFFCTSRQGRKDFWFCPLAACFLSLLIGIVSC